MPKWPNTAMTLDIRTITEGIIAAGVVVAALGYGYTTFIKGRRDGKMEKITDGTSTIELLITQVTALTALVDEQERKISNLTTDIETLRKIMEEKDKKLSEYMAIFQNRNPQFENFMTYVTGVSAKTEKYMERTEAAIDHVKSVTDRLLGAPGVAPTKP